MTPRTEVEESFSDCMESSMMGSAGAVDGILPERRFLCALRPGLGWSWLVQVQHNQGGVAQMVRATDS
jgi:hypothetical protein